MKDFYAVLSLSSAATDEEIKKAFRNLALKYHPDKNPSADAEDTFKNITEAYETLSDPEKRQEYDEKRKQPRRPPPFPMHRGRHPPGAPPPPFGVPRPHQYVYARPPPNGRFVPPPPPPQHPGHVRFFPVPPRYPPRAMPPRPDLPQRSPGGPSTNTTSHPPPSPSSQVTRQPGVESTGGITKHTGPFSKVAFSVFSKHRKSTKQPRPNDKSSGPPHQPDDVRSTPCWNKPEGRWHGPHVRFVAHQADSIFYDIFVDLEDIFRGCTKNVTINSNVPDKTGSLSTAPIKESFKVIIVRGAKSGSEIRFRKPSSMPMDVTFIVRDKPHPILTRYGSDLHYPVRISLCQALCGDTLHIPTIDGDTVRLTLSDVIKPNSSQRIHGRGLPFPNQGQLRGDLVIDFEVEFPDHVSSETRKELKHALSASNSSNSVCLYATV